MFWFSKSNLPHTSLDELSVQKNQLSLILSAIEDAVIAVDPLCQIVTLNTAAEQLIGYRAEEVIGKSIDEVIAMFRGAERIPATEFCTISADDTDGKNNLEGVKLVGSNNREFYVNLTTTHVPGSQAANLGNILFFHDITEEKQLEQMKLDFVSMAAHELRTPLTSLRGYVYVFMRDYRTTLDTTQVKILNRIDISSQRILSLVENLLNVTRIERGALTIHIEPLPWLENVKEVVAELKVQATEKHLDLTIQDPPDVGTRVNADKFRINEVLNNLLSNAVQYTKPGGSISVFFEEKDGYLITHVKDTGEGIPAEAIPHMFTKFFRVSGELEQGSKGTGLGLYIAKSIVDMHLGKIWVQSEYGKGSTFSFSLPISTNQKMAPINE